MPNKPQKKYIHRLSEAGRQDMVAFYARIPKFLGESVTREAYRLGVRKSRFLQMLIENYMTGVPHE